jgi:hypothetical protein
MESVQTEHLFNKKSPWSGWASVRIRASADGSNDEASFLEEWEIYPAILALVFGQSSSFTVNLVFAS